MQVSTLHCQFRLLLTDANADYVGSLTLPARLCEAHALHARELVHVRVTTTGDELWTYVITTQTDAVCLNGAAARLAAPGEEITVTAYRRGPHVDLAVGKIHHARVTARASHGSVRVDSAWMAHAGIHPGMPVHVVNVRSGRRDVLPAVRGEPADCVVGVRGYDAADLVIIMAYASVDSHDVRTGNVPDMRVCFPEHMYGSKCPTSA